MNLKTVLAAGSAIGALCFAAPSQAGGYVSFFGGLSKIDADGFTFGPYVTSLTGNLVAPITYQYFGNGDVGTFGSSYIYFYSGGTVLTREGAQHYTREWTLGSFREDDIDTGFVVGAALGFALADGWRFELESAYRRADISGHDGATARIVFSGYYSTVQSLWAPGPVIFLTGYATQATPDNIVTIKSYSNNNPLTFKTTSPFSTGGRTYLGNASADGDIKSFSIMANVWYDFRLDDTSPIIPFIGVGVGMARLSVENRGAMVLPSTTKTFSTDSSEWAAAWQVGAGIGYEIAEGVMLSAQYRYFATDDITVHGQEFGVSAHEALIAFNLPLRY